MDKQSQKKQLSPTEKELERISESLFAEDFSDPLKGLEFEDEIVTDDEGPKTIDLKQLTPQWMIDIENREFDRHTPPPNLNYVIEHSLPYSTGKWGGVAKEGCLLAVAGPAKSGKSTILRSIIASRYTDNPNYTLGFKLTLPKDQMILSFDTEMEETSFYDNNETLVRMCGYEEEGQPDNYKTWPLDINSVNQRIAFIDAKVREFGEDIGLLIVDGIVDLTNNINDFTGSALVFDYLKRWAHTTRAVIIVVIHVNEGSLKMRGALGTELKNKMFGCISADYDEETKRTSVKPYCMRKGGFDSFQFYHDHNDLPALFNASKF